MAPKPNPLTAPWLERTAARLQTYREILEDEAGYPAGQAPAREKGSGKPAWKGDHDVKKRPARSVEDEGGRQPLREWPATPSQEMQALRYGQTIAASFSPSRHAILVRGRPCVVQCVILSCFVCWLFLFVNFCLIFRPLTDHLHAAVSLPPPQPGLKPFSVLQMRPFCFCCLTQTGVSAISMTT